MRTILVPLDGSTLAESVYPYVRLLASALGRRVKLLRAIPNVEGYPVLLIGPHPTGHERAVRFTEQPYTPVNQELVRQQADSYLRDQLIGLRSLGIEAEYEVVVGRPGEVIAEVASELEDPIVVMATHGYGGLRRWMVGSVTDKVVHTVHCPVLVIHASGDPSTEVRLHRIMVPLDGSPLARQALPVAAEVAMQSGATELLALTAARPVVAEYPYGVALGTAETPGLTERMRREVVDTVGDLAPYGIAIETQMVNGFPAEVIVDTASDQQADLIVMATHGYSGLRRWALGSVADKVIHTTTTPVLLVRARDEVA